MNGYREPTLNEMQAVIEDHWKRHCKAYHRELVKDGSLDEAARAKAEQTQSEAEVLQSGGMQPAEAWSQAQREIALALI